MKKFPLIKNNITREDLDCVIQHLQTDDPILTNGPYCREFEKEWSKWLGVKHSVFVSSGSAANLISMAILKFDNPTGGEIIVPPLTWVSDIASVIQNGFTPIFCDINPQTLGMDDGMIIDKITNKTVAVFFSHIQGFNGLTNKLLNHLENSNIPLIEDACESHGATHEGKKAGSFGLMSNFSFYYAHHMSTIEGGMVCTNDDEVYEKIRMFRSHGMIREISDPQFKEGYIKKYSKLNPEFIFAYPAYNLRNTEIGALIGLNQLKRLDEIVIKRTFNQAKFFNCIDGNKFQKDFLFNGSSNYAFNLILRNQDDDLMERLEKKLDENGIEYRKGSAGGGNQLRQPYIEELNLGIDPLMFPYTEHVHFYGMYIGNFPTMLESDIEFICSVINSA